MLLFVFSCFYVLLSDAKVLENITQYVVRGDFAGDVGEMEDALANVLGYKVAAELGL